MSVYFRALCVSVCTRAYMSVCARILLSISISQYYDFQQHILYEEIVGCYIYYVSISQGDITVMTFSKR